MMDSLSVSAFIILGLIIVYFGLVLFSFYTQQMYPKSYRRKTLPGFVQASQKRKDIQAKYETIRKYPFVKNQKRPEIYYELDTQIERTIVAIRKALQEDKDIQEKFSGRGKVAPKNITSFLLLKHLPSAYRTFKSSRQVKLRNKTLERAEKELKTFYACQEQIRKLPDQVQSEITKQL